MARTGEDRRRSFSTHLFVFFTGAAVMATEMCASRFLAPWFGATMIVWAVIIAVIMAAMATGYWVGGRVADRRPSWNLLYSIPVLAGVFIALIPPIGRIFFARLTEGILSTPVNIIVYSFLGVIAVFVPPVLLLATLSPFAVRLLAASDNTGRTAGSLYASSTVGSIFGTVIPAFATIPLLGTRETMLLCSALLIVIGSVGLRRRAPLSFLLLGLPAAVWLLTPHSIKTDSEILHEEESLYQYIQVQDRGNGTVCLVVNEGGGIQSIARRGDELRPGSTYYESYLMLPYMLEGTPDPDILVVGSAAGTIPHWLAVYVRPDFPDLRTDAVEIDPRPPVLGLEWFGTRPEDATSIISDGRLFVAQTDSTYDVIITDAYSNQVYIPFQLTTIEYFSTLSSRLNEGGIVAMNVNVISGDSPLLQSMARTLEAVFEHVYAARIGGSFNFMLIASDRELTAPLPWEMASRNPALEQTANVFQPAFRSFTATAGQILTDNRAPVEFMTDAMIAHEAGVIR
jgi:spermidine synthase